MCKDFGLKDTIGSLPDEELFTLLAGGGMLVKCAIFIGPDFVLAGFKQREWEAALLESLPILGGGLSCRYGD